MLLQGNNWLWSGAADAVETSLSPSLDSAVGSRIHFHLFIYSVWATSKLQWEPPVLLSHVLHLCLEKETPHQGKECEKEPSPNTAWRLAVASAAQLRLRCQWWGSCPMMLTLSASGVHCTTKTKTEGYYTESKILKATIPSVNHTSKKFRTAPSPDPHTSTVVTLAQEKLKSYGLCLYSVAF